MFNSVLILLFPQQISSRFAANLTISIPFPEKGIPMVSVTYFQKSFSEVPVQFQFSSIAFPGFYPIGSMVLLYMVTWIPSIYPLYVSIYTSTMDPSWVYMLQQTRIPLWDDPQVITTVTVTVTDRMA